MVLKSRFIAMVGSLFIHYSLESWFSGLFIVFVVRDVLSCSLHGLIPSDLHGD